MNEFFTWQSLGTMAGSTAAVVMVTQFVKWLSGDKIKGVQVRALSFIIAFGSLMGAAFFTGTLDVSIAIITVLNAVIVTLAANGLYDGASEIKYRNE